MENDEIILEKQPTHLFKIGLVTESIGLITCGLVLCSADWTNLHTFAQTTGDSLFGSLVVAFLGNVMLLVDEKAVTNNMKLKKLSKKKKLVIINYKDDSKESEMEK